MSQQHTPGPWTVDGQHYDYYASFSVKAGGRGVCAISSNIKRPGAESAANARLIAAAPDLLAALQAMVDAYQQHFDVMPVAWQTYDYIARAAIAKATGGAA